MVGVPVQVSQTVQSSFFKEHLALFLCYGDLTRSDIAARGTSRGVWHSVSLIAPVNKARETLLRTGSAGHAVPSPV